MTLDVFLRLLDSGAGAVDASRLSEIEDGSGVAPSIGGCISVGSCKDAAVVRASSATVLRSDAAVVIASGAALVPNTAGSSAGSIG